MSNDLKQVLTECFRDIDKDKSGFIEQGELESLLKAYFSHPDCPAEYKSQSSDTEVKKVCQVNNYHIKHIYITS
jgi:Ca2+-binding EF-hand superfamily protein